MKLTTKQKNIIDLYNSNSLRRDDKGRFYYHVSTETRRSGQMLVTEKEINTLKKAKLI